MPEIAWDKISAIAEPGTPHPNFRMKMSAKIIFAIDAMIKQYKGVRLSPNARIILAKRL